MPVTPFADAAAPFVVTFQPAPYMPDEKMPTYRTPSVPLTPCTAMAPTGSSILSLRSTKNTASMTTMPEMQPITAAAHGCTNAHGAVMATSPASMPLAIIPGSGLPVRFMIQNIDTTAPNAPAIAVLAATVANWMSVAAS